MRRRSPSNSRRFCSSSWGGLSSAQSTSCPTKAATQGAASSSSARQRDPALKDLDAAADVQAALVAAVPGLFFDQPTVDDVANILDQLIAPTLTEFDTSLRQPSTDLINELLAVGLSSGQLTTVSALATNPQAPSDTQKLEALAEQLLTGSLTMLLDTSARATEVLLEHFEALGQRVIQAVQNAAKAGLAVAEQVVNQIAGDINQLGQEIEQLTQQIVAAVADIAQEIADLDTYLQSLVNTITQSIKDDGWSFFESVLQDLGLAGTPVEDAARGLYDDAFSAIQWLLDAPLAVLKDLAEFIHNELMPRAINGQATPQVLSQAIASHISAQSASDLSIPLKFNLLITSVDLGTWTLPAPQVLGSISNGVLETRPSMVISRA